MLSIHWVSCWICLGWAILIWTEGYIVTWRSTQNSSMKLTHSHWPLMFSMRRFRLIMLSVISIHALIRIFMSSFLNLFLMNCKFICLWIQTMYMTRSLGDISLVSFQWWDQHPQYGHRKDILRCKLQHFVPSSQLWIILSP